MLAILQNQKHLHRTVNSKQSNFVPSNIKVVFEYSFKGNSK